VLTCYGLRLGCVCQINPDLLGSDPNSLGNHSNQQSGPPQSGQPPPLILSCEFVPPDAKDAPAGAAEGAVDETVAGYVAGDLGFPELRVAFGLGGVDRTAVPETAVHEDGEFELGENEVRFAEDRGFAAPAGYTV
jgi:hypothetical protein